MFKDFDIRQLTGRARRATTVGNAACLMKATVPNNTSGATATILSAIRLS